MAINLKYTTGYAGTGKSTQLIDKLKSISLDTAIVIAPTHKALHRLVKELPSGTEVKTIHALLGWIPSINEEATNINHIDSTIKLNKPLAEYTNIVIDEAGMMSEDMFFDIISKVEMYAGLEGEEGKEVEVHCFLDPYQLLPVKGTQIQTDPLTTTNLTTQYRAESPDVVALYTKFVRYLEGTNTTDLSTPYSDNVLPFDISKFKKGDRLLAYTNKAVGSWNKQIAKNFKIHNYEGQEVQLGSMSDIIFCKEFIKPDINDLLEWFNTGKLRLQNTQINKRFLELSLKALIKNKNISFIISDDGLIYPVIVGIDKANIVLKEAKMKAVRDKKYFADVYALGRAYIMDYTFATTVHKAQGDEFNTVFIDKKDIQNSIFNNYYNTYARLMYVSISRAKSTIYI